MLQKTNLWFTKSRRAQSNTDAETWIQGGVVPTLNAFDSGDSRAVTLIFYGNRVDDIRIQGAVINTLQARMGTGGNNMPMVTYPIQDGRDMEKNQNGLGIGEEADPSYTLDRTGGQAVAYSIREDAKANNFSATETDTALTLQSHQPSVQSHHAQLFIAQDVPVAFDTQFGSNAGVFENQSPTLKASQQPPSFAYDEFNDSIADVHHTLRAGTKQSTGAIQSSVVRRLTPTECERLQGFPDGWTEGQADSNRYKQMGNAVAVPVVEWIVKRLVNL